MKILGIAALSLLGVSALTILLMAIYSGKPIRKLILNSLFGIITLLLINLTKKFTGVYIPVNVISVVGVTVFSIPAVIGLLVLNLIFI